MALPQVENSTDRFHLIKLLNKQQDRLRIKTARKLKTERLSIETELKQWRSEKRDVDKAISKEMNPEQQKLQEEKRVQLTLKIDELEKKLKKIEQQEGRFSHIRFLLGRNYQELNRDQRRLVRDYLRVNVELKEIYWLCQDFRKILIPEKRLERTEVAAQLVDWCTKARKHLGHFVKTLETWWTEVLNACLHPLNNGRAEGFNNLIKMIKRQGCGYRNRLNFKLKIQAACNL